MDDMVKIYEPAGIGYAPAVTMKPPKVTYDEALAGIRKHAQRHPASEFHAKSKWKRFCDYLFDGTAWKNVFVENAKREHDLEQKYPWFEILYRWTIALLIFLLCVSFVVWGINIHTRRTAQAYADSVAAQKDAEHQAFIAQQEADKLAAEQSLENLMKANAQVKAKLGYGSRNFIEKYNYSDADFMTLYQCIDNRLKNSMYAGMTIDEIAFQEGQFIASFDTNPVQDYYFNLAMKSERLKQNQVSDPVGTDYVYTIYTPHGIFLANDPKAPAYTWWRYSE